jgi:TRAP-type C4-dicarboxylate transport system permease small subunit
VISQRVDHEPRPAESISPRSALLIAGWLLLVGFVVNTVVTLLWHPGGDEDNHPRIFTKYAESGGWVATHLAQFICVLVALAGLLLLYRALRARDGVTALAQLAAGATMMTAGAWAVLQGVDGVALKQAVDAWVGASGGAKADRFSNAETVRWLEWGLQCYFRISLGLALALFGSALVLSRIVAGWVGWVAIAAGVVSAAIGVDVAYQGLASGFQDTAYVVLVLAILVFAIGLIVSGRRSAEARPAATAPR